MTTEQDQERRNQVATGRLARIFLARKSFKLAAIAVADKMAHFRWSIMIRAGHYQPDLTTALLQKFFVVE
ncbi:hypothetical protein GOZ97_25145 [Agrobacterium vitis]|uniref:hypothetical protein n=1 Tax=Rhizobium/Agrobacterium group TaxID=227290 RepID=UPI0008DC1F44|nr:MULTISPECIES: hypothetical protein [Rhizobium/Agrobacterium group]MCF1436701.1 hypothetical protein [Allorhizobium ampelinum]MUO92266.1 hypothetical protein [Agrobacterium vitis]MUZ55425.1 hypothetical protein [Agrobacterium vitis]MUZ94690.1 hypothetical protein [Agrobacterium vitis]MVA43027.1 hypothetical protein [Agrobacterium vitis]